MSIYMNLLTDFAFKKIFADPANKELLIDFINSVLQEKSQIVTDITLLETEQLGQSEKDRSAVYDLYCVNQNGEQFVVEVQQASQEFFKDRTVYYSSFVIQKQGEKGKDWNYELRAIYVISLLNFNMPESRTSEQYYHKIKLMDVQTKKLFYEKLTFIYVELPKFNRLIEQLGSHFEKWLYLFCHLETLQDIPTQLTEEIFMKVIEKAKVSNLKPFELTEYETTLKTFRDNKNTKDYAIKVAEKRGEKRGERRGVKKKSIQIAELLLAKNYTIAEIADLTGLSQKEIEQIQTKNDL